MTSYTSELYSAYDHPDPREIVERVKSVVQRRLLTAYPSAEFIRTEFFNHTYVPDLLMTLRTGRQRTRRGVYLRTSSDARLLLSDVQLLSGEQRPLLVPLDDIQAGADRGQLGEVAEDHQTLVLTPSGLDALPSPRDTRAPTQLASGAVIEGGRGFMDGAEVGQFLDAVGSGVDAARSGDRLRTAGALDQVTRRTVPDVSQRVAILLAAMWQGGGQPLGEFPGSVPARTSLDGPSVDLLLTSDEISDADFWRRISPLLDYETLVATGDLESPNLQHFMRMAVGTWHGHVCMVTDPDMFSGDRWRWAVEDARLVLRTPAFTAYLAPNRRDLPTPDEHRAPLLEQVRRRATRFAIPLTSIRIQLSNRSIGYDSPGDDVTNDPQLDGISAALGQEEGVVEALALARDQVPLKCSFTTRTSSPPGARTLLPYADLLDTAVRLFTDIDEDEASELADLTGSEPPPAWGQESLFE